MKFLERGKSRNFGVSNNILRRSDSILTYEVDYCFCGRHGFGEYSPEIIRSRRAPIEARR